MAAFFADPTILMFLRSTPVARLTSFPGSPLTAEVIAKLVTAVGTA